MDPFGNDPFEDIVREFFGQSARGVRGSRGGGRSSRRITPRGDNKTGSFIETDKEIYVIFELPGYKEEDITVNVNDRVIEVIAKKKNLEKVQSYLKEKFSQESNVRKSLPENANKNKYDYKLKNGILEIKFNKK